MDSRIKDRRDETTRIAAELADEYADRCEAIREYNAPAAHDPVLLTGMVAAAIWAAEARGAQRRRAA